MDRVLWRRYDIIIRKAEIRLPLGAFGNRCFNAYTRASCVQVLEWVFHYYIGNSDRKVCLKKSGAAYLCGKYGVLFFRHENGDYRGKI